MTSAETVDFDEDVRLWFRCNRLFRATCVEKYAQGVLGASSCLWMSIDVRCARLGFCSDLSTTSDVGALAYF